MAAMNELGRLLIIVGAGLLLAGVLLVVGALLPWFGNLPGDIVVNRDNFTLYAPIVTMILVMFLFVISVLLYMSWKGFKDAHEAQAEAVAASLRDDLTGLAHRREMLAVLGRCLAAAPAGGQPVLAI